jgi:hypothetical protein
MKPIVTPQANQPPPFAPPPPQPQQAAFGAAPTPGGYGGGYGNNQPSYSNPGPSVPNPGPGPNVGRPPMPGYGNPAPPPSQQPQGYSNGNAASLPQPPNMYGRPAPGPGPGAMAGTPSGGYGGQAQGGMRMGMSPYGGAAAPPPAAPAAPGLTPAIMQALTMVSEDQRVSRIDAQRGPGIQERSAWLIRIDRIFCVGNVDASVDADDGSDQRSTSGTAGWGHATGQFSPIIRIPAIHKANC